MGCDVSGPATAEEGHDDVENCIEDGRNLRVHKLSTGEEIWDLAGNVRQWIDVFEDGSVINYNENGESNICLEGEGSFSYFENDGEEECSFVDSPLDYSRSGGSDLRFEIGPYENYNAEHGVGRLHSRDASDDTLRAFIRGGSYLFDGGIYTLRLLNTDNEASRFGFRCTFEPDIE